MAENLKPPDAPKPPPPPPPERNGATSAASAIGRLEAKGYDPRSSPFDGRKAPEGKLPSGSDDPIQRGIGQKAGQALEAGKAKLTEATNAAIRAGQRNPMELTAKAIDKLADIKAPDFAKQDLMKYLKVAEPGMRAQIEVKIKELGEAAKNAGDAVRARLTEIRRNEGTTR